MSSSVRAVGDTSYNIPTGTCCYTAPVHSLGPALAATAAVAPNVQATCAPKARAAPKRIPFRHTYIMRRLTQPTCLTSLTQ